DAYFERLASQSATEMARRLNASAEHADRPPGSASLARTDTTPARRRRTLPPIRRRFTGRRRIVSVALSGSVALLGAALLAVVLTNGAPIPSSARTAGRQVSSSVNLRDSLARLHTTASYAAAARERADHAATIRSSGVDRRAHGTRRAGRRSHSQSSHAKHHALRPANTTAADTTSQQVTQTPASASTPPPTAPATSNYSPSTGSGSGSSVGGETKAFGLGGELGPGHSSIG
ncbi:MAG: hypothetical protein ACRDNS_17895, partial [Trebonia sp.]